jgi:hypothetical protein
MNEFLQGRINLIKELLRSDIEVHYADLVLIVCTVLSACASRRWPNRVIGIDRKKFIELLVIYSSPDFRTSWVSVPSLLNAGLITNNQTPYGKPGYGCNIYCDDEIDLSIEDAMEKYHPTSPDLLQEHCYASLIYERLRCGYSHEYCAAKYITHVPPSRKDARISYIGRLMNNEIKRMISFHLDYLIKLAEYHVAILPNSCSEYPSCWWIDKYKTNKNIRTI